MRLFLSLLIAFAPVWDLRAQILAPILYNSSPGSLYTVTFNCIGANGTNITALDANWSQLSGTSPITIQGNLCNSAGGGTSNEVAYSYQSGMFHADQYSMFTFSSPIFNSGDIGPSVRMASAADTEYFCTLTGSSTGGLFKHVAGTQTQLGSSFSHTWAAGDVFKLSVIGTTLTCTVNGSVVVTTTDSSIASGAAGVWGFFSSAKTFTAAVSMGNNN